MIVICIIAILAAIAIPNFRKAREQARERACYANQRVLQGAIEMYNLDRTQMMTGITVPDLISASYLKTSPEAPETGCSALSASGDLTAGGRIVCPIHGPI